MSNGVMTVEDALQLVEDGVFESFEALRNTY